MSRLSTIPDFIQAELGDAMNLINRWEDDLQVKLLQDWLKDKNNFDIEREVH